jgi:hypothetical protein
VRAADTCCRKHPSRISGSPHAQRAAWADRHVDDLQAFHTEQRRRRSATRRLLDVQKISHDPADGQDAIAHVCQPLTTQAGTRIAGLRLGDPCAHALLAAICVFRLLPRGFANRDLRPIMAQILGVPAEIITPGKMTYDLRRLRMHGLIERIPGTFRYQVTDNAIARALFLTRLHDKFLRTDLAELSAPPDAGRDLAAASRTYARALDDLAQRARLAA